ncbi:MAG: N-acetylmuramoyl-L-alanine amidase [Clostridium perfringens]|nr:N-acetylmuramoyl-L-alanine amidase [Clostridium butyricum]MDU5776238.1 N-acetylmuramoyl-L-alanine amidase [Clostridium perfringens]
MLEIKKQFINYNRSSRSQAIKYIVIHSTGNVGDTAQNNHDYFAGGNRGASADFFVDDNNIIQIIDSDNYYSWQVGDGKGAYSISNSNSIGIEMCGTDVGNISDTTIKNTLDLVKYLMERYSIDADHIVRHYDASRKCCPSQFSYNSWARWYDFKDRLTNKAIEGTWILDNTGWWYKHSDGSYTKDGWEKIEDKWYLFNAQGYMLYSWQYSCGGNWYYLGADDDGSMKTEWVLTDNKWYYLNEDGAMQVGWQKIDNNWYHFDNSGAMQTGWIKDDGKDYLLYSNGVMVHDTVLYGYRFESNGVATKI